jgi:hypothetical protein
VCSSLAARSGRAVEQLKVVGVVWIEVKTRDVRAFQRFGCGPESNGFARRRQLCELNQSWLTPATRDGPVNIPQVEFYHRCVKEKVSYKGKREQSIESGVASGTRADRFQQAARGRSVVDVVV